MEDGLWNAFHTDGKMVYNPKLMTMPKGTDFATIHKVERYRDWYADNKHVYYENRLLPGANPKTRFYLHTICQKLKCQPLINLTRILVMVVMSITVIR